jgi:hypothetical protein
MSAFEINRAKPVKRIEINLSREQNEPDEPV